MSEVILKEDRNRAAAKRRMIIIVTAIVLFTLMAAFTLPDYLFIGRFITKYHNLNDMALYYYGGIMLSRGNPHVYNPQFFNAFYRGAPEIQKVHKMLNYPPPVYCLFSIPAKMNMNYEKTSDIWFYLNHLFLAASVFLIFLGAHRRFASDGKKVPVLKLFLYLAFALLFSPVLETMIQGQVNLFLLLLLSLTLYFYLEKNYFLAGVFAGIATGIKIIPGIILLLFILRKRYEALAAAIFANVVMFTFIAFVFGPALIFEYFQFTSGSYGKLFREWIINNQSLPSFIGRLFSQNDVSTPIINAPGIVLPLALILMTGVFAAVLYLGSRPVAKGDKTLIPLTFSLFITSIFLLTPMVWGHHLAFLVITLILWGEYFINKKELDSEDLISGIIMIVCLAGIGAVDGFISSGGRPVGGLVRFQAMKYMIPQVLTFTFWGVQSLYLFRLNKKNAVVSPDKNN